MGADVVVEPLQKLAELWPEVPFFRFDLTHCPLPDNCVDAVVILNVLEHIEDDSEFMNKVKSLIDSPDVPKIPESEDIIPEVEESDEDFLARMQEMTKNSP